MRNKIGGVFLVGAGLLVLSVPLRAAPKPVGGGGVAHHGTASFDMDKDITLKGIVTEWVWSNPHCFLKFDVKDQNGTVTHWAVETQNPTTMTGLGWARNSFKAGDEVTVTLQAVKNGAPIGRAKTIVLPNGKTLAATGAAAAVPVPAQ